MKKYFIISFCICVMFVVSITLNLKMQRTNNSPMSKNDCRCCKMSPATERYHTADTLLAPDTRLKLFEDIEKMPADDAITFRTKSGELVFTSTNPWIQRGPFGMEDVGQKQYTSNLIYYSGRVFSLAYNESELFYNGLIVGCGGGGLWREDGSAFDPIGDNLPSLHIGAVAIDPGFYDRIFVGTGHFCEKVGAGIFRTTDGGAHWEKMSISPTPTGVSRIIIRADWVFVASDSGIFRSWDLGDHWQRVFTQSTSDLSWSPNYLYLLAGCPGSGLYKSTNYGGNWEPLCEPFTTGLPPSGYGRISVDISKSNPNTAYAQVGNPTTDSVKGIYKTTNGGSVWTNITPAASFSGGKKKYLGQQAYNNALVIHPTNPNIVWAAGVLLIRTSDGGSSWSDVGATGAFPRYVHGDVHALLYEGNRLFVGSDGGVFETTDEGATWSCQKNRSLPISIFHNMAIDALDGKLQAGGMQDNGIAHNSRANPDYWVIPVMGDGVDASISALPSNYFYSIFNGPKGQSTRLRYYYDGTGGTNVNQSINQAGDTMMSFWGGRICADPISAGRVYTNADNYAYWSTNHGDTWSRLNVSPLAGCAGEICIDRLGSSLYVPTNTESQKLVRFDNVGNSWTMYDISAGFPSNRIVKRVATSKRTSSRVFALRNADTGPNRIYMSTDKGNSWTNITGDLPNNLPVHDIMDHPEIDGHFIIGTEMSCFISTNGGTNWIHWTKGMPSAVRVKDLELTSKDQQLYAVAATWGRSTFERPLSALDPHFHIAFDKFNFSSVIAGQAVQCNVTVKNSGNTSLNISSVYSSNTAMGIKPSAGSIAPEESLKFYFSFTIPVGMVGNYNTEVYFIHDAAGSPSRVDIGAYVGDPTSYRTFPPESLMLKKEVQRKITSNTWDFIFDNDCENRYGAKELYVEFKNPVNGISSSSPFRIYEKLDSRGKKWKFSSGIVEKGGSVQLSIVTKKMKEQIVKNWWWVADIATWNGDMEGVKEGILCEVRGQKSPEASSLDMNMPNAANIRKDIFDLMPFNRINPLIIGVADPNARDKKVAYVALSRHSDLYGSLTPGRSGKQHDGSPRRLDYFNNNKKMIGCIRKLTPDKQSNQLFSELMAFKLNLYASDVGITPPYTDGMRENMAGTLMKLSGVEPSPFRSLKYIESGHPLNNLHLHEIDSLADVYMTYGDSSLIGGASELYSAIYKINRAFVGPIDTISFASRLMLTSTKAIAEVPFLERDTSYYPRLKLSNQAASTIPDEFELYQNYPNPFNPTTTINFELPGDAIVSLKIYDIVGREVATIVTNQSMEEGLNEVMFDGSNLASGIYFYRVSADGLSEDAKSGSQRYVAVKKMVLLK